LERLLLDYPNIRGNQNVDAANEIVKFVAAYFGETRHLPAAAYLWQAENTFSDPLVKAAALAALGKMQAVDYLPQVIRVLEDLNNGRASANSQDRGRIAYGAIVALENYADPSGFLPVFLASTGWYSESTKNQAKAVFPKILADPTKPLLEIVRSTSYDWQVKQYALQTVENASVSVEAKAGFAAAVYAAAWNDAKARGRSGTVGQQRELASIRKFSISAINRYKSADAAVYGLLERSYNEGYDTEEKIGVITALSSLASEESVRILSSFLSAINDKLQSGRLRQEDERMIREIIPALGRTGRGEAATALRSVRIMDWTTAVKRLAADALTKVQ
jgi:hypothetical protein